MTAADPATASERDSEPPAGRPSRLTVVSQRPTGASAPDSAAEPRDDAVRGALLAVCGLCGGAGASTLAYLVALAEARRRSAAVLVVRHRRTRRRDLLLCGRAGAALAGRGGRPRGRRAAGRPAVHRHRRPAGARDRPAVRARVRPGGDRADPGLRARALRADRDRLRHPRPRSRPARAGERLAHRVGAARQHHRDPPRAPRARGDQPLPARAAS